MKNTANVIQSRTHGVAAIKWLVLFILVYAAISCIICLCGMDFYGIFFPGRLQTVVLFLFFGILIYVGRKFLLSASIKSILIVSTIFINVAMLTTILAFHSVATSDNWCILFMAERMWNGDYTNYTNPTSYEFLFNWQTGMAVFEYFVFHLVGRPSFFALKIVSFLAINANVWLIYFLSKQFLDKRTSAFAYAIACFFIPIFIPAGQLAPTILSAPVMLGIIILILKKRYFLAGIWLPLLNFIRPIGVVIFIAIVIWLVLNLCNKWMPVKSVLRRFCLFLIPCVVLTVAIDQACIKSEIAVQNVSTSPVPLFKFRQGLNIDSWEGPMDFMEEKGWTLEEYNAYDRAVLEDAYLHHPFKTFAGHLRKMVMLLGTYDWRIAQSFNHVIPYFQDSPGFMLLFSLEWAQYIVLILLAIVGWRMYFRSKTALLPALLLICFIGAYFFIEAWSSYRYDFYPFLILIGACGLRAITDGTRSARFLQLNKK